MRAFYLVLIATILKSDVDCNMDEARKWLKERTHDEDWYPPYDKLNVTVFGDSSRRLEDKIYNSMQETHNFFSDIKDAAKYPGLVMKSASLVPKEFWKEAAKFIPYATQIIGLAEGFMGIFEVKSNWKRDFAKELANLMPHEIAKGRNENIGAFLKTVKQTIPLMNATIYKNKILTKKSVNHHPNRNRNQNRNRNRNQNQNQNRRRRLRNRHKSQHNLIQEVNDLRSHLEIIKQNNGALPTVLHVFFLNYINLFATPNSTFMQYPLLGAPILIELSLMGSVFEPMAMQLNEVVASGIKLSCMLRDTVMDFLPFVVAARLDALNANLTSVVKVRNEPYNPNGYNKTKFLPCVIFPCTTKFNEGDSSKLIDKLCLIDSFSTTQFIHFDKINGVHDCEIGYAQYVRHLVEKMFPIDILNKLCNRPIGDPTGEGWATIKLKKFEGTHLEKPDEHGMLHSCDDWDIFNKCDPYVKLYIGDDDVLTTETADGTEKFNVDRTIASGKIKKNSTIIHIEVWDSDSDSDKENHHQLMLMTNGTVESFMQQPIRCTEGQKQFLIPNIEPNCLEVDIIWLNERK